MFGREREREREWEFAQNYQENLFFFLGGGGVQNEGFWGIYSEKVTLQQPTHLVGPPATLLMLAILAFFSSNSYAYLNAFLDLDWADFGVLGKIWMSSFQNTKETENPIVESKVMVSGSALMRFSWFYGYLNHF